MNSKNRKARAKANKTNQTKETQAIRPIKAKEIAFEATSQQDVKHESELEALTKKFLEAQAERDAKRDAEQAERDAKRDAEQAKRDAEINSKLDSLSTDLQEVKQELGEIKRVVIKVRDVVIALPNAPEPLKEKIETQANTVYDEVEVITNKAKQNITVIPDESKIIITKGHKSIRELVITDAEGELKGEAIKIGTHIKRFMRELLGEDFPVVMGKSRLARYPDFAHPLIKGLYYYYSSPYFQQTNYAKSFNK